MSVLASSEVDAASLAAGVAGGLAGLLAVGSSTRALYRRTLGRRRDRYERLARLGTGAQLTFFSAVLGEPPAIRRTVTKRSVHLVHPQDPEWVGEPEYDEYGPVSRELWRPIDYTECFYIDRDFYVQTVSNSEETVLAFSVTTRSRQFRPTFLLPRTFSVAERLKISLRIRRWYRPLARIKLGKTVFADLDATNPDHWAPPHFIAEAGAHWSQYCEIFSFGNPGHYQTFVVAAGSNAPGKGPEELIWQAREQAGYHEWPYPYRVDPEEGQPPETEPEWEAMPAAVALHKKLVITTFLVIGPTLWAENFPTHRGPHGDEVRTLP